MWNVLMLVPATVPAPWDARRSHDARSLSSALALGSLLISGGFLVLGAALSRLPQPPVEKMHVFDFFEARVISPPPLVPVAPAKSFAPVTPTVDPRAIVRPVDIAEPTVVSDPTPSGTLDGTRNGSFGEEGVRPTGETSSFSPPIETTPDIHFVPDEDPVPIFAPKPEYPDLAMQAQVEGTVVVRALVRRDGRVGEIRVERGVPLLNDAAVAAVSRWTFAPARTSRVAVACWVVVPVRFRLNDVR